MALTAVSWPQLATLGASLLCSSVATVEALRARAVSRRDGRALRSAAQREAAYLEGARRLADAARESLDAVRGELARGVAALAPSVDGVLLFEETDDAELRCSAASGERFRYYTGTRLPLDAPDSLPVRALSGAQRVRLSDVGRPLHPADVDALAVPLVAEGSRRCAVVFTARRPFEADELERIATFAGQAAPAFAIAADRERDRRHAEYDGLTGLLTPRAFRARLSTLVDASRFSRGSSLALIFVDTDHFKRWNDTHGHSCGDALLREIARTLRAHAGPGDVAARNGGDEFCLVFADTGKARAVERAEQLRARIAALDVDALRPAGSREDIRITASLGIAVFPADAAGASELLECADAAMYHAKHTGRNGVAYRGPTGFVRLDDREVARVHSSAS